MPLVNSHQQIETRQSEIENRRRALDCATYRRAFADSRSYIAAEHVEKAFPIQNPKSKIQNYRGLCGKLIASKLIRPLSIGTSIVTLNAGAPVILPALAKIQNPEAAKIAQLLRPRP